MNRRSFFALCAGLPLVAKVVKAQPLSTSPIDWPSIPDGVQKAALALETFGKRGVELIPDLNAGLQPIARHEVREIQDLWIGGKKVDSSRYRLIHCEGRAYLKLL